MSGVTGANPIQGRKKFKELVQDFKNELQKIGIPCNKVKISGSYNSDKSKETFGDIDLILTTPGNKKEVKKELAKKITKFQGIEPFTGKYKGKMYYNSGEIISVRYKGAQIDCIIASDDKEAEFKYNFLNLPAEVQGLVLGAVKVYKQGPMDGKVKEYNLSSSGLSLREMILENGKEIEGTRKVLKVWKDWDKVTQIIKPKHFDDLLIELSKRPERERKRIKGVFKSMVSVKTGEQGKPKGIRKQQALNKVEKAL